MRQSMLLVGIFVLTCATTARAQLLPGGGTIPVIDQANLFFNQGTAGNTAAIEGFTGTLVQQGQLNLTPSGVYPAHDVLQLINAINEVLQTGEAVHYQLANIGQVFSGRYPGYWGLPQDWWSMLEVISPSVLDTLNGTLQTVHQQLNPLEWGLDTAMLAVLKGSIANPFGGNLSISQLQGMAMAHLIEELRKSRQMTGAATNAHNIAQAHHINLDLYSERLLHDTLEASQIPVVAYTGAGGYGTLGGF
jgi:hypothetical protein